ncbi:O-succinylhomoserine sulfhydrylase [Magnetofaba australis]|nr:O-succinylhomoserine sulfhydrylase [Magnetofaba australis]
MSPKSPSDSWGPATRALHTGQRRSAEGENSIALYLTSSFAFESPEQARARFADEEPGNIYSRFTNPNLSAFEERMAALEGGEDAVSFASGMAAISSTFLALLSAGDHIVLSRSVFGSIANVARDVLPRMGIEVDLVSLSDLEAWRAAIKPNTKMLFMETPANPTLEMGDIAALAQLAHDNGAILAVDNVFATPVMQQPLALGADLTVHSATKYLDGQGRVLGGAVVGRKDLVRGPIYSYLRNCGPTLSPFNAWVLHKGLETLALRMERHNHSALQIAQALDCHALLSGGKVRYPGLPSHAQHELAKRQMQGFGGLLCLELGDRERAYRFLNALTIAQITANLGDSRTLATHPATTTHAKWKEEARQAAGITQGLVRLSIGLEDVADLQADFEQALEAMAG